ncbi:MAG: galactose mutarotase [Acidobacteriota bacterium]|jgi:aldose 1-epimerase (EC 5.1.3.3)|nr:galactose mutarotase [Acidobacteriota bacterium]MDD8028642.1 galactose mutarotase [Acidobacteriota bacterium]
MRKTAVSAMIGILGAGLLLGLAACRKEGPPAPPVAAETGKGGANMSVGKTVFGTLPDGSAVDLYTLADGKGLTVRLMTYGATLVSLEWPDRDGALADCVLGYDTLDGYLKASPYFGATVGRYGNRIARGRFALDGNTYTLAANNGQNHLHGGVRGFDKILWKGEPVQDSSGVGVRFTTLSPDGDEGYPGNLDVSVTYVLTAGGELIITYVAKTDKPTVINLTHHGYFNLTGGRRDVLGHELELAADRYTPVDAELIPTGLLAPVENTPMDFRTSVSIGSRIAAVPGGYDHNYVLNSGGKTLASAARVFEPESGRVMEIRTVEPGLQFYSGNFLDGSIAGKAGRVYGKHWGFCLETQHFPDSPNRPEFPSTVLRPGETYRTMTVFKFSAK